MHSVPLTPGFQKHIVVVGAGIVGASTAWHLAKRGYKVTLLDREPPKALSDGASGGNAGLLSIGHYPLTRPGVSMRGLKWMFSRTAPLYIKPRLDRELVSWLWNFHLHCNQRHLDRCMEVLCAMGWQTLEVLETRARPLGLWWMRDGTDPFGRPAMMCSPERKMGSDPIF
jgi:D-amino-acid dehydrogenase